MPTPSTPKSVRPALFMLTAIAVLALGCNNAGRTENASDEAAATVVASTHDAHDGDGTTVLARAGRDARRPGDELTEASLHDLDMIWRDQDSTAHTMADLGERPLVMAMIYTTCAHTCPLIIADLKQMESALTPRQREAATFVLVSLDPEHDTPTQLRTFATDSRLDLAHWTLLTGSSADVRMLAASLGVRYRPGADDEIAHTNALTIVDTDGVIAYQQRGVGSGTDAALRALVRLLQ